MSYNYLVSERKKNPFYVTRACLWQWNGMFTLFCYIINFGISFVYIWPENVLNDHNASINQVFFTIRNAASHQVRPNAFSQSDVLYNRRKIKVLSNRINTIGRNDCLSGIWTANNSSLHIIIKSRFLFKLKIVVQRIKITKTNENTHWLNFRNSAE